MERSNVVPQISRKPFSAVLRTHRPHSAKSEDAATSLFTTVQYPRSVEARNVVFTVEQRDSQWTVESLLASELLPRLAERKSVYLQPPKVVQEGEFSNVRPFLTCNVEGLQIAAGSQHDSRFGSAVQASCHRPIDARDNDSP